jgi:glycosyltransferase involved in cell wall biosynthesis
MRDGNLRQSLESQAKELGISNDVHFVGSVPNVGDYLQAMDAFVFPSIFE